MIELRQSTAGQEVPLGYFLDSGDGDTAETGLSIANTDIKLWKWGATGLTNKNSGGATHISGGIYYCVLNATDTNTLGPMVIFVHVAGALTVRLECAVLTANVWNSKYSTDKLEVDLTHIHDTALTETSGQLAGRFVNFFDQESATFNVSTALSSFMANVSDLATTADLLNKLGAVDEAAAAGDPSATESVMQYVKQIVNVLVGAAGVGTFPAEAAPGNAVSLAEVIRAIHADVTGLNGSAMVGTNSAALASVLGAAVGASISADIAAVKAETATIVNDTDVIDDGTSGLVKIAEDVAAILVDSANLNDTGISELSQGVPAKEPTLRNAVMLLYMALRNKLVVQTSGTDALEMHNDAGTLIAKKLLSDDGADYTEAKATSGA